jgi:hypothetical protein
VGRGKRTRKSQNEIRPIEAERKDAHSTRYLSKQLTSIQIARIFAPRTLSFKRG